MIPFSGHIANLRQTYFVSLILVKLEVDIIIWQIYDLILDKFFRIYDVN